jgi:hypothetical protein
VSPPEEKDGTDNGDQVERKGENVADNVVLYTPSAYVKQSVRNDTDGAELGQRLGEETAEDL